MSRRDDTPWKTTSITIEPEKVAVKILHRGWLSYVVTNEGLVWSFLCFTTTETEATEMAQLSESVRQVWNVDACGRVRFSSGDILCFVSFGSSFCGTTILCLLLRASSTFLTRRSTLLQWETSLSSPLQLLYCRNNNNCDTLILSLRILANSKQGC